MLTSDVKRSCTFARCTSPAVPHSPAVPRLLLYLARCTSPAVRHPPHCTLQAIAQSLSQSLDIRFEHRVSSIDWGSGGVSVTCTNGAEFEADAVIVTTSIGVLQVRRCSDPGHEEHYARGRHCSCHHLFANQHRNIPWLARKPMLLPGGTALCPSRSCLYVSRQASTPV